MDLKTEISTRHSKEHTEALAQRILDDPPKFEELWSLIKVEEPPIPQRGAWVLDKCATKRPDIIQKYIPELIQHLPKPNHNAVHRSISKALSMVAIPEEHQGELFSLCIDWLMSPNIHVAIKAHSMSIAYNIAKGIPELEEELALVIRENICCTLKKPSFFKDV